MPLRLLLHPDGPLDGLLLVVFIAVRLFCVFASLFISIFSEIIDSFELMCMKFKAQFNLHDFLVQNLYFQINLLQFLLFDSSITKQFLHIRSS